MKQNIAFLLVFILLLSSCNKDLETNTVKPIELPKVQVMQIHSDTISSFTINGNVQAEKSATITSELRANVSKVHVSSGEKVTEGQVLISLSSDTIDKSYEAASSSLYYAKNTLDFTKDTSFKDIEAKKLSYEKAEDGYNNLLKENVKLKKQALEKKESASLNLYLSLDSSAASLENAKKNLEKTKTLNNSDENSARVNLENAVRNSKTSIHTSLNTLDEILGISNQYSYYNDGFEQNLGALKTSSKHKATRTLKKALKEYSLITESLSSTKKTLISTEDALIDGLDMLKHSISSVNLSQEALNAYINSVNSGLGSVRNSLSSLLSTEAALEKTLESIALNLETAEQSVVNSENALNTAKQEKSGTSQLLINAEAEYETTIAKLESLESTAKKQLEEAKNYYENSFKSAGLSKSGASSQVAQAVGSFDQALINKEKLTVRAPFDGDVEDVLVKLGDEVNPNAVLIRIEDTSAFKLIAFLTPNQVKSVQVGDEVQIGEKSKDIISAISSTADVRTGKYKAEILHENKYLHSSQVVPLKFSFNNAVTSSSIVIPLISLHISSSGNFVWLIDSESKTVKKYVKTGGIIENSIEVLSGLEENDTIIIEGARVIKKEGIQVEVLESE